MQFDAGQATRLRLSDAGFSLTDLNALFITHHHSDHMMGLTDLLNSYWMLGLRTGSPQLPLFAPDGMAADISEHVMDVWRSEAEMRIESAGYADRSQYPDVRRFTPTAALTEVARFDDVVVSTILVEHSPVLPAVGYRVESPDGVVAISGDTRVCDNLQTLCQDADVAVCEALRPEGLPPKLATHHSDAKEVGAMAARAGVGHLVLTHLIPPPKSEADKQAFADDVREGGFTGELTVADDLTSVEI